MAVELNHTIVFCREPARSAAFLAEILGRPAPKRLLGFHVVEMDNRISLDFLEGDETIAPQHYAFLIAEDDFDRVFARIRERGLEHWADPGRTRAGEIYRHGGGRGVYFQDPDGHLLEVMTRPYASDG